MAQSKSCTDFTDLIRKCILVASEELGYSALKPEQSEVITAFVGWRDVFAVSLVSQLDLGKPYMYAAATCQ